MDAHTAGAAVARALDAIVAVELGVDTVRQRSADIACRGFTWRVRHTVCVASACRRVHACAVGVVARVDGARVVVVAVDARHDNATALLDVAFRQQAQRQRRRHEAGTIVVACAAAVLGRLDDAHSVAALGERARAMFVARTV